MSIFHKFLKYSILAGIFAIPFIPLVIASNLFFPFITGKNFIFRAIVETILSLWIILAYIDKSYRPKKSFILWSALGLIFILTLSTFLGENIRRSFWSNFERMEGLISYFHLFAYFLVLASALRKEKEWFWFFHTSIGVSVLMSIYGLLQLLGKAAQHQGSKVDATLGNSTYLAIYLVFHLFLILFYFLKTKNIWLRVFYAAVFIFELIIIFYTTTRGAILGLAGGILLLSILGVIFLKRKKRYLAVGIMGSLIFMGVLFLLLRNADFVKNNAALNKIATTSLGSQTAQSRLTIWSMSWQGFKEHPVLGWGLDNFNLVFNKYYRPSLYNQESWFDRAHNIIFDWLVSVGILGLLFYLSLIFLVILYSWKNYRKGVFSAIDASIMTSLILAYFFHNFFVFDNIVSYILFFSILAFIHSRFTCDQAREKEKTPFSPSQKSSAAFLSSFVAIAFVFTFYFVNVPGYLTAKTLLDALQAANRGDINLAYETFDQALKYNSFGSPEAREQLAQMTNQVLMISTIPPDIKDKFFMKAEAEFKKQIEEAPSDARYYLFLGSLYLSRKQYDNAISSFQKAKEFSPQKQQIYFELGDVYMQKGDIKSAIDVLKTAYDLDSGSSEAASNFAIALIAGGRKQDGIEILRKKFGSEIIADPKFVRVYFTVRDFDRASQAMDKLLGQEPGNFDYRTMAASLYFTIGNKQRAIEELQRAIALNPGFKDQGEKYIREIKEGKNP